MKATSRLCCRCAMPIAGDSLTTGELIAHVGCVQAALREPLAIGLEAYAAALTDEQLRKEFLKRGLDGVVTFATILRTADDEELHDECTLRFPSGFGQVHETTLRDLKEARTQRDQANVVAETFARQFDEQKRLASAVETELAAWKSGQRSLLRDMVIPDDGEITLRGIVYRAMRPASMTEAERLAGERRGADSIREAGPGIAVLNPRKPDASVAWLDEDLLCEDA